MNRLENIKKNMETCTDWYVDNSGFLDDMRYMLQRLERYEKALKDIGDVHVHPLEFRIRINLIIEEALKE